MPLDPVTGGLLSSLGSSVIGGKQLGGIAPAFSGGASNFDALKLGDNENIFDMLQAIQRFAPQDGSIESLIGSPQSQGQELAPQVTAQDQPVTSMPSVFNTEGQNAAMQPQEGPGKVEGFFGNLDQNLQSPSKVLGVKFIEPD